MNTESMRHTSHATDLSAPAPCTSFQYLFELKMDTLAFKAILVNPDVGAGWASGGLVVEGLFKLLESPCFQSYSWASFSSDDIFDSAHGII